ncbi:hypothetical protein GBAR_LOCUS29043 [Geodia barretti]|nr:hypothetical protein GBAR_LOCUS29043 [Geodia barretti]
MLLVKPLNSHTVHTQQKCKIAPRAKTSLHAGNRGQGLTLRSTHAHARLNFGAKREGKTMEETKALQEENGGEEGGLGARGEAERETEGGDKEAVAEREGENQAGEDELSQPEKPPSSSAANNNSRYLENEGSTEKKMKKKKRDTQPASRRMTRAERARLEALASFGGTDLASVAVKKRDLREELQRDVKLMEQGENKQNRVKRRSRTQQNSSDGVKDVLFGERAVTRKRKLEVSSGVVGSGPREPKTTRRMTKAEKARLDALQSFGGCGFNDVLATSKRKIARNFEMKAEKEGGEEEGEVESAEKEEGREG